MAFLLCGDLAQDGFLACVKGRQWPESAVLMAFQPDGFELKPMKEVEIFPETTRQGRIFWPDGELQWRCLEEGTRMVYLGNTPDPYGLDDYSTELDGLERNTAEFMLWGIRTDMEDEWIEQQVPQRFVYPVGGRSFSRGRVMLKVERWVDNAGVPRFSRYHSLKEIKGGE